MLQVIDTKWKRIAARIDDPKQRVSQADVYQMMAYGRLYRCGKLTLLYPHHDGVRSAEGLIGDYAINAGPDRLEIFSIEVAQESGKGPARAPLPAPPGNEGITVPRRSVAGIFYMRSTKLGSMQLRSAASSGT